MNTLLDLLSSPGDAVIANTQITHNDFSQALAGNRDNLTSKRFVNVVFNNVHFSSLNMQSVVFTYCYFKACEFNDCNLSDTYFFHNHFANVRIGKTNLSSAIFRHSPFVRCFIERCNLEDALFDNSHMMGSQISENTNIPPSFYRQTLTLPEGDLIVYKSLRDNLIAKLLIPSDAKRSHSTSGKFRASKAKVLEISNFTGTDVCFSGRSFYNNALYETGKDFIPNGFDTDPFAECSHGVHFFITREEAIKYDT